MATPQSLPPSTTPTSDQTSLISPSSAPLSPSSNNAEPILPTSSDNMNPSPIQLSVPAQVHLPDVYASSSAAKRGGSFEIMNEGEQTLKVDLEKRGVEVEFWASPPPEGERKHGDDRTLANRSTGLYRPHTNQSSPSPLKFVIIPPSTSQTISYTFSPTSAPLLDALSPGTTDSSTFYTPKHTPKPFLTEIDGNSISTPLGIMLDKGLQPAPNWWLDGAECGSDGGGSETFSDVERLAQKAEKEGPDGKKEPEEKSASMFCGEIVLVASRVASAEPSLEAPSCSSSPSTAEPAIEIETSRTYTVPFSAAVCESSFSAYTIPALEVPSSPESSQASLYSDTQSITSSEPSKRSSSSSSSIASTSLRYTVGTSKSSVASALVSCPLLQMDFGSSCEVQTSMTRELVISNDSDIPLVSSCEVVFDCCPWQAWVCLVDTETGEEIAMGGHPTKPVTLPMIPSLSTRTFQLVINLAEPADFSLDLLFSNVNNPSNLVVLKATGSCPSLKASDNVLHILSGPLIDFGDVVRGVTTRQLLLLKNSGDTTLEVVLGKETGVDAKFVFGGVKGDELDDEDAADHREGDLIGANGVGGGLGAGRRPDLLDRPSLGANFFSKPTYSSSTTSSSGAPSTNAVPLLHPRPTAIDGLPPMPHSSIGAPSASAPPTATQTSMPLSYPIPARADEASVPNSSAPSVSAHSSSPSRPSSRASTNNASRRNFLDLDDSDAPSQTSESAPYNSSSIVSAISSSRPSPAASALMEPPRRPTWNQTPSHANANQIEELLLRPGVEYRVYVSYTPCRIVPTISSSPDPGSLVPSFFRVTLDYSNSSSSSSVGVTTSRTRPQSRRTVIPCHSRECSSLIKVAPSVLDLGTVVVGSNKQSSIEVENLGDLTAKCEFRFISKVLSAGRIFFTIPPREKVVEKIDFCPRRINAEYSKQLNVRNLSDRSNDQMVEIRACNVDLDGVSLHSHLYKILTPSGSNILDFGQTVVNSPALRTITIENIQNTPLSIHLSPAHPEDMTIYIKADDASRSDPSNEQTLTSPTTVSEEPKKPPPPPPKSNRERFLESMAASAATGELHVRFPKVALGRRAPVEEPKPLNMVSVLKKGSKGRSLMLFGNVVIPKDRNLLATSEYLDLAGPPISPHRLAPPRDTLPNLSLIENEDPSKIAVRRPGIMKRCFADSKSKPKTLQLEPSTPKKRSAADKPDLISSAAPSGKNSPSSVSIALPKENRSPALTAKRKPKATPVDAADVSQLSLDQLISTFEHHDLARDQVKKAGASKDAEELYVRTWINLKSALQAAIDAGKLIPVDTLALPPKADQALVVLMKPSGSTRPQVQGDRSRRQDSRIFIRLVEFDRSLGASLTGRSVDIEEMPVRELLVRSSMTRSVLEVAQPHINFGTVDKGEPKSKVFVIHNRSETPGMFRIRLSGKIGSNDFKLEEGRYGLVEPFGKREITGFTFTPSLPGPFQEKLSLENVQDVDNSQTLSVKAVVRKTYSFWVTPLDLDFGIIDLSQPFIQSGSFSISNTSKGERTFIVEVEALLPNQPPPPCSLTVRLEDSTDASPILTKAEDEEVENILQKLKIARRKQKPDKIEKYESRLKELGVPIPSGGAASATTETPEVSTSSPPPPSSSDAAATDPSIDPTPASSPQISEPSLPSPLPLPEQPVTPICTRLLVQLPAGQAQSVRVALAAATSSSDFSPAFDPNASLAPMRLRIWEKKNADDVRVVAVKIQLPTPAPPSPSTPKPTPTSPAS